MENCVNTYFLYHFILKMKYILNKPYIDKLEFKNERLGKQKLDLVVL